MVRFPMTTIKSYYGLSPALSDSLSAPNSFFGSVSAPDPTGETRDAPSAVKTRPSQSVGRVKPSSSFSTLLDTFDASSLPPKLTASW